jgi:hypothetical protein
MNKRILIILLLVGLLSACGSQPVETPASQPTEESAPVIETDLPIKPRSLHPNRTADRRACGGADRRNGCNGHCQLCK